MLGLAVLFGLGLWLILTIVAMFIGWCLGGKILPLKIFLAIFGFVLVMGQYLVKWRLEYLRIAQEAKYLCTTEANTIVYVNPKEWRKTNSLKIPYLNRMAEDEIIFRNVIYKKSREYPHYLAVYSADRLPMGVNNDFLKGYYLLIDEEKKQVLIEYTDIMFPFDPLSGKQQGKVWFSKIRDCWEDEFSEFNKQILLYTIQESNL